MNKWLTHLIFQIHPLRGLPELAPVIPDPGCRGFNGPVPPPLWMSFNQTKSITIRNESQFREKYFY